MIGLLPKPSTSRNAGRFVFYRECRLAEKEAAKIEKMAIEDGDGKRLWELSERCLETLPAQL